ncbi:integrase [Actinomadura luteofluorescens]|uniref:Integrase n=1 Tax=Actinomadura luteofluorescens TaxID=46163 RepID=A0A7Y9EBW8_9ACTN|nr:integrase [Actinomadura luteofluorescens]
MVSLLTGVRTEEARALQWAHVVAWSDETAEWRPVVKAGFDRERFAVYVWRSVRAHGDTKTEKSRRTLELPLQAVDALRRHQTRQASDRLKAGPAWQETGLVFCSTTGKPLDAANVRRGFRLITKKAGIGETWSPRELRHSFVSIMSDGGVQSDRRPLRALLSGGHRGGLPAPAQAGDHPGRRGGRRGVRSGQVGVGRMVVAPLWLPIDLQDRKRAPE